MDSVSLYDAKANLSRLVSKAQKGEVTVITKHGKPAALLMPMRTDDAPPVQRTGFLKGRYEIPEDFDTTAKDEIIAIFEGDGR
ncbi:MAG: type II toxin-antitoxin system prevent-host-death family antitoxin [Actinomycetia bacterium]|nr:type II toxin-antitoxin system prevent-host-death family antitoxin [Actinomycetes bacterium]